MSAARARRTKLNRRPRFGDLPWRELLVLGLGACAASVWRWQAGPKLNPVSMAVGGIFALTAPAIALGWLIPKRDRWLGLGLVSASAILSRLGTIVSPYFLLWGMGVGLFALWSRTGALSLLLPLAGWTGVSLGGGPLLCALVCGVVMAEASARAKRGRDLLIAGLLSGVASGIGALVAWPANPLDIGAAFFSGPASALLIWMALPLVERAIDRASPLSLVELLNPSHPLLERMREESPGTYYHSRDVSLLAEAAARAVGADPLLATVGGLYHDIGKILRPQFFVENQTGANPHEELAPSMSKIVLAAHVKDGVELGRQYGLRGNVLRFVATHHGTSVMRYFSERGADQGLSPDEFRYDSPLPDTKETAIVSLADAVEAASRGRERDDLAQVTQNMVEERRKDGQLDHSPLTLADLTKVQRAFLEVLQGMAHRRTPDYSSWGDRPWRRI